jgi:hypothetical protein
MHWSRQVLQSIPRRRPWSQLMSVTSHVLLLLLMLLPLLLLLLHGARVGAAGSHRVREAVLGTQLLELLGLLLVPQLPFSFPHCKRGVGVLQAVPAR